MNNYFISAVGEEPSIQSDVEIESAACDYKFSYVEEEYVLKLIGGLDVRKPPGPGSINVRDLHLTSTVLAAPLTYIYNLCLSKRCFPSVWKNANVSSVFKKGDKRDHNNYRPISVIPVIRKTLEQIVYSQLFEFREANSILSSKLPICLSSWLFYRRFASEDY